MLTKEAQEKLLKLADFLEKNVKDEWFNIEHWATRGFTRKECGTTACAMGWATVCFPGSGLELLQDREDDTTLTLVFGDRCNTGVPSEFFGISFEAADYLFYDEAYPMTHPGRMDVVERLREFATTGVYCDSWGREYREEMEC